MAEFYSYWQNSTQSSFIFGFTTEIEKIDYSVRAEKDQELFNGFPELLSNGYLLGFDYDRNKHVNPIYDNRVWLTIIRIIADIFKEVGKEAVLLYYCDANDNRQKCRHRLFERWYRQCEFSSQFVKDSTEAMVPIDGVEQDYYFGYITPKNNPNLQDVKDDFDQMSILYSFRNEQK